MSDVSIRDYLEKQLAALDQRLTERFHWGDIALGKAEQQILAVVRTELERLETRINELEIRRTRFDGQLYLLAAALSFVVSVGVALVMRFVG